MRGYAHHKKKCNTRLAIKTAPNSPDVLPF